MAIEISDNALDEVRRMMEKGKRRRRRFARRREGRRLFGPVVQPDFETQARTGDKVFERDGIKLFCDLKSYIYLNGTVLDYDSGLMGKGFVFMNPNAKKSCGCGSSFST